MLLKTLIAVCLLGMVQLGTATDGPDCSKFPNPIDPRDCCRFPELFKTNALELCNNTRNAANQCFYECVFAATEICRKGKCSYNKAEDYIDWVMTPDNPFMKMYKMAYKKCIRKANELRSHIVQRVKRRDCDPLPEMIYLCVQNEIFTSCPTDQWDENVPDCANKRQYIEKCIRND